MVDLSPVRSSEGSVPLRSAHDADSWGVPSGAKKRLQRTSYTAAALGSLNLANSLAPFPDSCEA